MILINEFVSAFFRIVAEIYDSLSGCDYQLLLLYYALLNQVAENEVFNHLKPKEHMRFLRRLKTFSKSKLFGRRKNSVNICSEFYSKL